MSSGQLKTRRFRGSIKPVSVRDAFSFAWRALKQRFGLFAAIILTFVAAWVVLEIVVIRGQQFGIVLWAVAHAAFLIFFGGLEAGFARVCLDLYDGKARNVTVGSAADAQKCDFVITAPYTRWKEVATKQLDATKGMLQGKLKLKGDLPTIVRYTKASQEMTECTTRVPVEWPDES